MLKFQILELEIEKKALISEKEKNDLKIKEIDLHNEQRKQEIGKFFIFYQIKCFISLKKK